MEGRVSDIKPAQLRECASDWILNGATNEPGRQEIKKKEREGCGRCGAEKRETRSTSRPPSISNVEITIYKESALCIFVIYPEFSTGNNTGCIFM